ncbi:AAA family ATPase [uncultured Paludibaculum sp.]|uniref:AAA family ATPase n=1 Tax=uncultured Paludibaculum sp. TaxID=1765020 RepID=UPI002AAA8ED6|nr:AAA family ATPase [uncultured Paludibaculum sp.]
MILSFSLSNFRSFNEEETISFVASKRLAGTHDDHLIPIPDTREHVLRCAVLYGANGGGKSNLFKALRYLSTLATEPRPRNGGTGREPFRLGGDGAQPSTFDLQFVVAGKVYRYGLDVLDERIAEEWLVRKNGARETRIFERTTNALGQVHVDLGTRPGRNEKLAALATVGGPPNQSFLATANNILGAEAAGEEISEVLAWLKTDLVFFGPDTEFGLLAPLLEADGTFRKFAGEFLRLSGTGIERLEVQRYQLTEAEFRLLVGDNSAEEYLHRLRDTQEDSALIKVGDNREIVLERHDGSVSISDIRIRAAHQEGSAAPNLDLADESDGTRRLLHLLPALDRERAAGKTFFIDEIDRSLHPILAREFLAGFLKSAGVGSQLIVTTHESSLLDQDLLRRDEVWFVEKDQNQASRLYSLADFKVRKDLELRKHYLQGRFGAVPFIGDLAGSVLSATGQK